MRSRARTGYRSALIAAVAVLLLTPTTLLRQGEAMQEGVTRSITLAVARPVSAVSRALHLERTASSMLAGLHIGDGADAGTGTPLLLRKDLSLPPPVPPQALRAPASGGRATALGVHGGSGGVDPRLLDGPPRPRPTAAHPLRLLVTGDSLVGYLGPQLADSLAAQQVQRYRPDATVVMLGANDDIGMPLPSGHVAEEGSPRWAVEYQRRLEIVMGILSQRGRAPVLWLTLPLAREARRSRDYALINAAARQAARAVPSMRVVEVGERFTPGGRYRDSMTIDGRNRIVRQPDGVHLNQTGSRLAADIALDALRHSYDLPRVEPSLLRG